MANIEFTTRTIETITATIPDDVLGKVTQDAELEIVIASRYGAITRKISYGDIRRLTGDGQAWR
jgi:hypothetical protein